LDNGRISSPFTVSPCHDRSIGKECSKRIVGGKDFFHMCKLILHRHRVATTISEAPCNHLGFRQIDDADADAVQFIENKSKLN
jgi:hypothetical protein